MLCEFANKLMDEAQRTQELEDIPEYHWNLRRAIVSEVALQRDRANAARIAASENVEDISSGENRLLELPYVLFLTCIRRNKRCLSAYHCVRASKIESQVWEEKVVNRSHLNTPELAYLRAYSNLVTELKGEYLESDLTFPLEPPKDAYCEVRILVDGGDVVTENGVITLRKDQYFYARRSQVQRFAQQGLMEIVH